MWIVNSGILPIKKDGSQSAISDFKEFSMIKPRQFGEYVGFTEEVKNLCEEKDIDFDTMKRWYDGYAFHNIGSIYNPSSVMQAVEYDDFDSYWSESSAAEGLMEYISQDYSGLTKTIAELIGGVDVKVNTTGFANNLTTFKGKDDVLTLLIHLGYLTYDAGNKTVRIPNEEIKLEFQRSIHEVKHEATLKRLQESEKLFADTITKYSYRDHYIQFEELPAGEGYADVVYFPKHDSDWPALVIELKWNKDAQGAIEQILEKKYPSVLENCGWPILLVGITYEKDAEAGEKTHKCKIIEYKA